VGLDGAETKGVEHSLSQRSAGVAASCGAIARSGKEEGGGLVLVRWWEVRGMEAFNSRIRFAAGSLELWKKWHVWVMVCCCGNYKIP
jgi:hypothetical protein